MELIVYLLKITLTALFSVLELAMLVRALLSWFGDPDGVIATIAYMITEPVILPIRLLCEKFGWFEDLPVDVPFVITVLILPLVETLVALL